MSRRNIKCVSVPGTRDIEDRFTRVSTLNVPTARHRNLARKLIRPDWNQCVAGIDRVLKGGGTVNSAGTVRTIGDRVLNRGNQSRIGGTADRRCLRSVSVRELEWK